MKPALDRKIAECIGDIVALRHELHAHPELRFQEEWTSGRIASFLEQHGVPFEKGYARGTGIVATLRGSSGKCIALRAELDALPIEEKTNLSYSSQFEGRMHACGHDGHMAALCGVAAVLAQFREKIPGTIKFIFQPGEENAGGAYLMVQEGVLDGVDAIVGFHGWPDLPFGCVGLKSGVLMAGAQEFRIEVLGKGAHGAAPHKSIDPVPVAAHIILALHSVISRRIDPLDSAVLTVAQVISGTGSNIIPDSAELKGTLRAFDDKVAETLRESIIRISDNVASAFGAAGRVTFCTPFYPPLVNHESIVGLIDRVCRKILGTEGVVSLEKPVMMAEDFAFYLQRVPGCLFYLGIARDEKGKRSSSKLHTSEFDFPDDALELAMRILANVTLEFLIVE